MTKDDIPASRLPTRIALASIAGFWIFYFAILSIRAMAIYQDHAGLLWRRAIVSTVSAGITVIFYLLMRRVPANRLIRSIIVAALLAVPATLTYSTVNWTVFDYLGPDHSKGWSGAKQPVQKTVVIVAPTPPTPPADDDNDDNDSDIAPPAPPAPPQVITVGKMSPDSDMTPLEIIADQAVNGYFFFICWATLYLALCYAAEIGALERRAAALSAAAQAAELRALRYQVNPHFLFNTLNSLSSLVLSGKREEAERMIINLATFFRTSLTGDPTEDVPLVEEMRLQRLYLDIEQVRFPERLQVEVDIPHALKEACIPGLILQPVIENAVKYAVSRVTRPVTIRIAAGEVNGALRIVVEDDGDPVDTETIEGGTGVGLRNVRDRLRARFGDAGRCRWGPRAGGGFAVSMTMPLVIHDC